MKAKLSGDVRVNFKSDYLPLEKMATPEMMSVIQGNSTPYNPNKPPAAGRRDGAEPWPPRRSRPSPTRLLASALSASERLVARATAPGLAFALDQLGDIDIPEPAAARIDKAQLRALATLYLAADLESAGIIPAVEALAGLASTGAVSIDLGGAEPLLADWWRRRHDRVSAAERNAFFSRLFGTASGPVAADADRNVRVRGPHARAVRGALQARRDADRRSLWRHAAAGAGRAGPRGP